MHFCTVHSRAVSGPRLHEVSGLTTSQNAEPRLGAWSLGDISLKFWSDFLGAGCGLGCPGGVNPWARWVPSLGRGYLGPWPPSWDRAVE